MSYNRIAYSKSRSFTAQSTKRVIFFTLLCGTTGAYAACGTASGVSFYGLLDAAVQATDSGGTAGSTTGGVASGNSRGSRLGVRGHCILQPGIIGIFDLEAGINLNNGTFKNYFGDPTSVKPTLLNGSTTTGFNRRSFVGLETPMGTLSVGRDYSPVFYAAYGSDALALDYFGNFQEVVPIVGGTDQWARFSNAVFYKSPSVHGFTGRIAYSFGSESTGAIGTAPSRANSAIGLGGSFHNGKLLLNASWQQTKIPSVAQGAFTGNLNSRTDWLIGGTYKIGVAEIGLGHWNVDFPTTSTANWIGISYAMLGGKAMAETISLKTDVNGGANKSGTSLALAYEHPLGNGAAWYISYGQVSNDANSAYPLVSGDYAVVPGALGAKVRGFAVGYRMSFD